MWKTDAGKHPERALHFRVRIVRPAQPKEAATMQKMFMVFIYALVASPLANHGRSLQIQNSAPASSSDSGFGACQSLFLG
jgi:hypothetical protein